MPGRPRWPGPRRGGNRWPRAPRRALRGRRAGWAGSRLQHPTPGRSVAGHGLEVVVVAGDDVLQVDHLGEVGDLLVPAQELDGAPDDVLPVVAAEPVQDLGADGEPGPHVLQLAGLHDQEAILTLRVDLDVVIRHVPAPTRTAHPKRRPPREPGPGSRAAGSPWGSGRRRGGRAGAAPRPRRGAVPGRRSWGRPRAAAGPPAPRAAATGRG